MDGKTWYLLGGCSNLEYTHKPVNYEMAFYVQLFHVILHFQGFAFLHCCIVALQCVGILQHKSSSFVLMRRRISGNACISMIELYLSPTCSAREGGDLFLLLLPSDNRGFSSPKSDNQVEWLQGRSTNCRRLIAASPLSKQRPPQQLPLCLFPGKEAGKLFQVASKER